MLMVPVVYDMTQCVARSLARYPTTRPTAPNVAVVETLRREAKGLPGDFSGSAKTMLRTIQPSFDVRCG